MKTLYIYGNNSRKRTLQTQQLEMTTNPEILSFLFLFIASIFDFLDLLVFFPGFSSPFNLQSQAV